MSFSIFIVYFMCKKIWEQIVLGKADQLQCYLLDIQIKIHNIFMEIEVDQSDKKSAKNRVKVGIRVRPMIARELVTHQRTCVEYLSKSQIVIGGDRQYKFDRVFRETSTQEEVYEETVKELIMGCFEGYNAAVLAYGQTGSGKTYTMGTNTTTMDCNEEGMIPKVIHELFSEIEKRKNLAEFHVKASFLEIYNEQIIDLLDSHKNIKVKDNGISIRQEKDGSVSIYGAIQQRVSQASDMLALLDQGSINRTTAATMMNESSSRSHAIFTIFLQQHRFHQEEEGFITAKFFFVDLAGSERAKKTGATGATLKEGISINLGLLELGNVISALAVDKKQPQFITYRNSKLTRILQDSLGGNSNTYMIACISPAESNYEQSLNTLKYASKAMNIKNKPIINRDPHSALLNSLRQRIKELQQQNHKLQEVLKGQGITFSSSFKPSNEHEQQFKALNGKLTVLQRKNQKVQQQLKQEKKRKNQLQIQSYELQRECDMLTALLQQIKTNHPEVQFKLEENSMPLIQNYLTKIQQLQTEILEREKVNNQLQIQYTKLRQSGERDEQILIKKNQTIYNLARENKDLKKAISELKKEIYRLNNITDIDHDEQAEEQDGMPIIHEVLQEEESLEADEEFKSQVKQFNANEQNLKTELKKVQNVIEEKENILNKIASEQMELQYKLIEQMKEEYHQKINELEKEKNMLIKQQRSQINTHNISKYSQKIDVLEHELRQFRNKAKEQKQLEQRVSQQSQTIKTLGNDIKTFKMQKIQLHRLLKQDQEMFQKYKHKRTQELMYAKKQNLKKDVQIRKLTNENKRKNWCVLKKNDQLKRIRKVNQTLKKLTKPYKKTTRNSESLASKQEQDKMQIQQEELNKVIQKCIKNLLIKIDRQFDIQKYTKKCQQIDKQLDNLVKNQSNLILSIDRLQLQDDKYELSIQEQAQNQKAESEMRLNLNQATQRINNLQQSRQFCYKKYEELISDNQDRYNYNYEAQIIYNPAYNSINAMRQICKAILVALQRLLVENYNIKVSNQEFNIKNTTLQAEIQELKENIVKINLQNQQNISRLREQMMFRMYQTNEIDDDNNQIIESCKLVPATNQQGHKLSDAQKKNYERKILELTRNNIKLSSDLEVWRRKCSIIQDKYQSMRSLFDKDKFIGRPIRQEENNINYTNNAKDQRKYAYNSPVAFPNKVTSQNNSVIEQLNSMAQKLKSNFRGGKKSLNLIEQSSLDDENKDIPEVDRSLSFTKYKWECVSTIDAHNSPILAIKNYKHMLISAATRSIRLWDLQTNQMSSDITGINLNSFVKALAVAPEKQLLAASCDKLITLWDLRTSNSQGVLRGHKDQIRAMRIVNNYLFSAGKGLTNSGGLLVWDLRYLNFNNPMQEKQRSQDIFSMTSHNNILYYGTRDHHVRRLNIDSMETLTTFQPPHMDTVTGLAISRGYLISGSKDKNLRLWSLDNSIYNLKSTFHAFNDYITTVESDNYHPLFYSSDRTGQVKVGTVLKQKIEFIGMMSHAQSVNSVCSLQINKGITATGSSDKTIKLWQPNNETFHQLENNLC